MSSLAEYSAGIGPVQMVTSSIGWWQPSATPLDPLPTLSAQIVSGANQIRYIIVLLPIPITIRRAIWKLITAGAAGSKVNFGIANTSGNILFQVGPQAADGALTTYVITGLNTTLIPSLYAFCWTGTDANIRVSGFSHSNDPVSTTQINAYMGASVTPSVGGNLVNFAIPAAGVGVSIPMFLMAP